MFILAMLFFDLLAGHGSSSTRRLNPSAGPREAEDQTQRVPVAPPKHGTFAGTRMFAASIKGQLPRTMGIAESSTTSTSMGVTMQILYHGNNFVMAGLPLKLMAVHAQYHHQQRTVVVCPGSSFLDIGAEIQFVRDRTALTCERLSTRVCRLDVAKRESFYVESTLIDWIIGLH